MELRDLVLRSVVNDGSGLVSEAQMNRTMQDAVARMVALEAKTAEKISAQKPVKPEITSGQR